MKRVLLSILSLAILATAAVADSVSDYVKVRKANKISGSVGTDTLNSLVGSKVLEIRATVKGIIKIGDQCAILLDNGDGSMLNVRTRTVPDWIADAGSVDVRMIVKATRAGEFDELETQLVHAIPEALIAPYDVKAKPVANRNSGATVKSNSTNSNGNPFSGSIGPRGSKIDSRTGYPNTSRSGNRGGGRTVSKQEAIPEYATFIKGQNKRLSDDMCFRIAESVIEFSLQYGVDPRLVMAMAVAESNFNPNATSHAGAQGLLQLMPGTARGLGVSDSYDIVQNVFGAVKLISGHLNKYMKQTGGDPEQALILALAAYNAGSGAVKKHGGVPPYRETQNYVRKIATLYFQLKA